MFKIEKANLPKSRWPVLFSVFLNKDLIKSGKTLVFSAELAVSTTGYQIENQLWFDEHIPGEFLFRDTISIRATEKTDDWTIRYVLTEDSWGENRGKKLEEDNHGLFIPLKSRKGFKGKLRLQIEGWK